MSLYRHNVCVEPNDDLSRYVPMCAGGGLDIGSPATPPEDAPAVAAYRNGDNGEPLERTWNQNLSDYMLYKLTKRIIRYRYISFYYTNRMTQRKHSKNENLVFMVSFIYVTWLRSMNKFSLMFLPIG